MTKRNLCLLIGLIVAALLAAAPAAMAQLSEPGAGEPIGSEETTAAKPWSVTLDFTYNSKYVWRGIEVTSDPVMQPSITAAYQGLSFNVWTNIDTTDVNSYEWQSNEIIYTLDYSFTWKYVNFSVGANHYAFPQAHVGDTTEVYFGIGSALMGRPTVTFYQDVDEHRGTYIVLSMGHTFENVWQPCANLSMGVDVSGSIAWGSKKHNTYYYGTRDAWTDAVLSLGLPFAIGEHVTITPAIHGSMVLDKSVRDALADKGSFWGGITVAFSF